MRRRNKIKSMRKARFEKRGFGQGFGQKCVQEGNYVHAGADFSRMEEVWREGETVCCLVVLEVSNDDSESTDEIS